MRPRLVRCGRQLTRTRSSLAAIGAASREAMILGRASNAGCQRLPQLQLDHGVKHMSTGVFPMPAIWGLFPSWQHFNQGKTATTWTNRIERAAEPSRRRKLCTATFMGWVQGAVEHFPRGTSTSRTLPDGQSVGKGPFQA